MNEPAEKRPFYKEPSWVIGFVVSMAAVVGFYFFVIRPAQIRGFTQPTQIATVPAGQVSALPGTVQPGSRWTEGITFTAPGSLPSDLLRVGEEVWVFTEEGKQLARLNLKGEVQSETALEILCSKAAWDGEAVWCVNTSEYVSKVDPETGKELNKFATGNDNIQSIAWDGNSLWLLGPTGGLARYNRNGERKELKGVGDFGFARDLAWMGSELWVVYIPPLLVHYDANLKSVEKTSSSCGLTKGVLDYAIDWDGKSLWFLDFISAQVLQCVREN